MLSKLYQCVLIAGIMLFLVVADASSTPRELPFTHENPILYEQLDIVPMPKQIKLLDKNIPLAGARLATGPAARRCAQSAIGTEFINAAIERLDGAVLPVMDDTPADTAGWSIIIGTCADNRLIERAVSDGLADIGKDNPGERGYEIRVDEKNKCVYLAGADVIGALYACVTFAELIANNNGNIDWRAAEIRDWPDTVHVWYPLAMNGPHHSTVWSLLLPMLRKYAWAEGALPPIPAEERAAYLDAVKAEYDRLLRAKVNAVFYPTTYRQDKPYRPLEIYDILREGIEYGNARGFAAVRYAEAPVIGSIERYPELEIKKCNCWKDRSYGWCEDAIREETAGDLAKAITHIGYTDVGFHDVDSGSYIDSPAGWENRCEECRKRWGDEYPDNYRAATAHKYMAYINAINAAAPGINLHIVFVPYDVSIFDPVAGRKSLQNRFGASADVVALADQQRKQWTAVWQKWNEVFPPNVNVVFRESTPEAVDGFTKKVPGRGVSWGLAYMSRAWASQFSDRPSMVESYARSNPRDVIWLFGYADLLVPATMLATAEYTWNLKTPGHQLWTGGGWGDGQPLLEHWKRGEPEGAVYDVILPHVVRNMFGRDMAPLITDALRRNVSPYQIFGYYRAKMAQFNPLTTSEKMNWQAENAAAAAAALDRAWEIFRARPDNGRDFGVHETAWLIFYREMFHAAAVMADIRVEAKKARELARAQDEAGAREAIARGEQKLAAAPGVMKRLRKERLDVDNNPLMVYANGLAGKIKSDHWTAYLANGADFSYAGAELAETLKEIPGLIAMGGVPRDVLDQLARPRTVRATAAVQPIVLDGVLNEQDWKHAFPQESFFVFQTERDLAQAYTRARLLYDSEYLYIGVTAYTPSEDMSVDDKDVFEVFLQHPGIDQDYIHLLVYPDGRLRQQYNKRSEQTGDMQTRGKHAYASDNEWTFDGIAVAGRRFDDKWTAELRIPLAAVKADKLDERMRINLCRTTPLAARSEASSIQTPPAKRGFHDPTSFLPVRSVGDDCFSPPEMALNVLDLTRETHTMTDAVGTVVEFRIEVEAGTMLHNVKITGETYDERGVLHERRELASTPRVFFRWVSDSRVSIRFTKVTEQGGVRIRLTSDEGNSERWIRWGGWEGTETVGALFAPTDEEGGYALAGACFFPADG